MHYVHYDPIEQSNGVVTETTKELITHTTSGDD